MRIREAQPADADALAALQLRAWARAYADIIPPERLDADGARERRETWRKLIASSAASRRTTLVADLDGQLAGLVAVGPARDDDARPGVGDLMAIYVDPPAQGAGVGRLLMAAGEDGLRREGYREAVLWVFEENGLARDFYERRGWVREPADVVARHHGAAWWAPALRYRLRLA